MPLVFSTDIASPDEWRPPQAGNVPPRRQDGESAARGDTVGILDFLQARGFTFEPWQIAAFVAAVRAKPFVILAGISGTGKTRLPVLVAEATDGRARVMPVRPDWTDGSDLLGFERLNTTFRPGPLLEAARVAALDPDRQYFFVLDEMNIARVEYYLAEVLSRIEQSGDGTAPYSTPPLLSTAALADGINWSEVGLPPNLCLVGSVNMDETTFGFSRKVLDRAFVIEFSEVNLRALPQVVTAPTAVWSSADWRGGASKLAEHPESRSEELQAVVEVLVEVNEILQTAQLQFGYRVRDEICLFWLAARDLSEQFVTSSGTQVDPLDIVIAMKVLPRVQGGGAAVGRVLEALQSWATGQSSDHGRAYPFVADRVALMQARLAESGFTSYWL